MKSSFKKIGLFLVLGLTTAVFYSCDKDDNDNNGGNALKITAAYVVNGSTQVTTVKALAYWESGDYDYGSDVIAQAPYANNGFTLELPPTVTVKSLNSISEDAMQGVSISNKNAKILFLEDIEGYDKDENELGYFYLEGDFDNGEDFYTSWLYADRDVTINGVTQNIHGNYEYIERYDLKLKKGWNVVYDDYIESYNNLTGREEYTSSFTSQKRSERNYLWRFHGNYDSRSAQATTKSVENKKSVFSKLKENKKSRTR